MNAATRRPALWVSSPRLMSTHLSLRPCSSSHFPAGRRCARALSTVAIPSSLGPLAANPPLPGSGYSHWHGDAQSAYTHTRATMDTGFCRRKRHDLRECSTCTYNSTTHFYYTLHQNYQISFSFCRSRMKCSSIHGSDCVVVNVVCTPACRY